MTDESTEKKSGKKKAGDLPPIQVHCARGERFCRAGRCFGAAPEIVTEYTTEQLEAWQAESNLVVNPVGEPA